MIKIRSLFMLVLMNVLVFGVHANSQTSDTTQELYTEARNLYTNNEFDDAKELIHELLANHSDEKVEWGGFTPFKVGPAVLDMLGRIYLTEKNVESAIETFNKMIDLYPQEYIVGPLDGEPIYGGPAGAIALTCLINIASGLRVSFDENPGWAISDCYLMEAVQPDYEKSIELAYNLMRSYQGGDVLIWEGIFSWEGSAAGTILQILKQKNEPVWKREKEVGKMNRILNNEELKADLLLEIGDLYRRSGQPEQAVRVFREVIKSHPYTFKVDEEGSGYFIVHSLDAYIGMICTYEQYKYPENNESDTKEEMQKHYEKFLLFIEQDYRGEYAEHYSDYCKRVYGTDKGKQEYQKKYMFDKYYHISN